MKALIIAANYIKDQPTQYGLKFKYEIKWVEGDQTKSGSYLSNNKDQTEFTPNQEAEFDIIEKEYNGITYLNVKPIKKRKDSNYARNLKKEQSRYTTMGASYVKDLIIAGKIDIKDWKRATDDIVKFMFELDKEIES